MHTLKPLYFVSKRTLLLSFLFSINTRTGEGSENHIVWRGGGGEAYNAPIDLISCKSCRDEFWWVSRATLEPFLANNFGPWINPFKVK